ncbi:hypothetical protein, partial [Halobacterium salinarum]|uniref:hypothetical protein n=1 Tax=Halobacterium salinarum TaxID=2242 RepID=UPI0025556833
RGNRAVGELDLAGAAVGVERRDLAPTPETVAELFATLEDEAILSVGVVVSTVRPVDAVMAMSSWLR